MLSQWSVSQRFVGICRLCDSPNKTVADSKHIFQAYRSLEKDLFCNTTCFKHRGANLLKKFYSYPEIEIKLDTVDSRFPSNTST